MGRWLPWKKDKSIHLASVHHLQRSWYLIYQDAVKSDTIEDQDTHSEFAHVHSLLTTNTEQRDSFGIGYRSQLTIVLHVVRSFVFGVIQNNKQLSRQDHASHSFTISVSLSPESIYEYLISVDSDLSLLWLKGSPVIKGVDLSPIPVSELLNLATEPSHNCGIEQ